MIENNWITLVKPNKVDYKISENKKFGTVVIEPLEKGFGTMIRFFVLIKLVMS